MFDQVAASIRKVPILNDGDLEELLELINKNYINAFAWAIGRIYRPEDNSHTFRSESYAVYLHPDTFNFLLSIGEVALCAIHIVKSQTESPSSFHSLEHDNEEN